MHFYAYAQPLLFVRAHVSSKLFDWLIHFLRFINEYILPKYTQYVCIFFMLINITFSGYACLSWYPCYFKPQNLMTTGLLLTTKNKKPPARNWTCISFFPSGEPKCALLIRTLDLGHTLVEGVFSLMVKGNKGSIPVSLYTFH